MTSSCSNNGKLRKKADGQAEVERFPWDFDDPGTPFWNDAALKPPLPRNFLTCFTAKEITQMHLDDDAALANGGAQAKLSHLLKLLQEKLRARESNAAPSPLYEAAWDEWQRLVTGICHVQKLLGLTEEEEASLRFLMKHGRDGKRNMSGVNMMAGFMMDQERYREAEVLATEALPWLQGHAMLGKDSPQALGCMRRLVQCTWKQGRKEEAEETLNEYQDLVEGMDHGEFGKYQDDELGNLRVLVRELQD